MKTYNLRTKEEAIEQIIEIESTYQFKLLIDKKGVHKALNNDKVAVMALEENSYQAEKSKIEEKKFDGTIKTVIENKDGGVSVKKSILNQAQSDNVAETKGALQALSTVEAKEVEQEVEVIDKTSKEEKPSMKVELINPNQELQNKKSEEPKNTLVVETKQNTQKK